MSKTIIFKEYEDFNRYRERERELEARHRILSEELGAVNKELDRIRKDRYRYSTPAVKKHKFWMCVENASIISVCRVEDICGDCDVTYVRTSREDGKDRTFHTSSLGIILGHPYPIKEADYWQLRDTIIKEFKDNGKEE